MPHSLGWHLPRDWLSRSLLREALRLPSRPRGQIKPFVGHVKKCEGFVAHIAILGVQVIQPRPGVLVPRSLLLVASLLTAHSFVKVGGFRLLKLGFLQFSVAII